MEQIKTLILVDKLPIALASLWVMTFVGHPAFSKILAAQSTADVTRPAVNPSFNEEVFAPIDARSVRFYIRYGSSRTPAIDELEIYTAEAQPRNVAHESAGARYAASSHLKPQNKYAPTNVGDGRYGIPHWWAAVEKTNVWVEVTFPQTERINRVVWSRDREGIRWDRTPLDYEIQVAETPSKWTTVASSQDRRPGLIFEPVTITAPTPIPASQSQVRPAVNSYHNEDSFTPIVAKYVRFTILDTIDGPAALDEVEIYAPDNPTNLALASAGATATSSNQSISRPTDQTAAYVNDGTYGIQSEWVAKTSTPHWVELALPKATLIDRVVWSRDRDQTIFYGTPTRYRIEVAQQPDQWQQVAGHEDRAQPGTLAMMRETPAPSEYVIDSWPAGDGLPLDEIRYMAQTPEGYLWLATDSGLLRFDGNQFTPFNRSNTPVLSTPRIDYLYVDRKGRLWMTNQKFFYDANNNLVVYEEGRFKRIELPHGHKCHRLFEEPDGSLWFVNDQAAVPWENGALDLSRALWQFDVSSLTYSANRRDRTTVTQWNGKPGVWNHDQFVLLYGVDGSPLPPSTHEGRLRQLGRPDGGAWILLSQTKNPPSLAPNGWKFLSPKGNVSETRPFPWTKEQHIQCAPIVDRNNNLWISVEGRGLYCFYADGRDYLRIPNTENLSVRKLFQDRDGSIWASTRSQGLKRIRKRLFQAIGPAQGIQLHQTGAPPGNSYSIAPARGGGVWIGTHGSGAYRWHEGQLKALYQAYSGSWSIQEDRAGNVWTGAYGQGAQRHNHGEMAVLPTVSRHPFAFLEDRQDRLWIGGNFGLSYLDRGTLHRYAPPDFATDRFEWVASLHEAPDGAIWAGTKLGYLHRFQDEVFETLWTPESGDHYPVCALYRDASEALWMARFGFGLSRYQDGKFTHFTPSEGLPTATINGILEDQSGFLWMTSKAGVYRISSSDFASFARGDLANVRWQQFTEKDGLPSQVCQGEQNQPSLCQTEDGRIWIPTLSGVGVIDPKPLDEPSRAPEVLIQNVTLHARGGQSEEELIDGARHRSQSGPQMAITIPPGNHSLMIRYTAIDFSEPKRVHFRYRITGLDDTWVDANNERSALIASLGFGDYTFEVMAINHLGQESEITHLDITVEPYWWETLGFRLSLLAGMGALGILLYRYRVQQLERRNQLQADFSRQLIEREENERKRISQELHDSLGHELLIVRNRALDGANHADSGPTQDQFDAISSMAGQALENARGMAYNLRPFELDRVGFKEAVETMITKVSETSDTRYFKDIDELEGALPEHALIYLYRLLQEALNNILKHAKASVVMLEIKIEAKAVHLQIEDNGDGFDLSQSQRGLGLAGMEERAKLIGGTFELTSSPGEGTRLRIHVPTNLDHKPHLPKTEMPEGKDHE